MKKFLLCLLLVTVCLACLVACGGDDTTTEITTTEKPVVTTPVATTDKGTNPPAPSGLEDAKAYLVALYKDESASTPVDYELIGALRVAGVAYTLEWSVGDVTGVTVTRKDAATVLIDVVDRAEADIPYTLTATITDKDGNSTTVTFERKVPMFKENTFAEYVAAKNDELIIVKGVVSGIIAKSKGNSSNCLYVQDTDGGYYVYGLTKDPVTELGVELGMTVRVTGKKDNYNGTFELKEASVEILNEGAKTDVVAKDLTDAFKAATDLKAAELVGIQGMYVTLKGVTIGELGTNGYHYFTLGNLTTYVRISSSTCPLTKAEQTAFTSAWESHLGWTADIAGVISVYDGKFYLTPCVPTDVNFLSLPELDDAGKVAFEKGNLTFTDRIKVSGDIEVPTAGVSYTGVVITWASDNACLVVNGGKITATLPAADTTVKVTATIKSGDVTDTKEFEVKVDAAAQIVYTPELVAKPEVSTAYKFAMAVGDKNYFFTGKMSGYYMATSEDYKDAVDVYIEAVDGGARFYFMDGETKTYIDVAPRDTDASKANIALTATPSAVWVYDEAHNLYTATLGEHSFYLGTYSTFTTVSVSNTSYITGENESKIDNGQYPARFYTLKAEEAGAVAPSVVAKPTTDKAYKFAFNNKNSIFYFTGKMSGYYMATSEDVKDAVDVYVEAVEGGFRFYFMDGETKTYIDVAPRDTDAAKANIALTATPSAVWTYDEKHNLYTAKLGDHTFYLGTYGTYTTISVSNTSYITGDNEAKIDVEQFPARFYELVPVAGGEDGGEEDEKPAPTPNDEPVAKKAYKVVLAQNNIGKLFYLTGGVDGRTLAVTENKALAADVYLEANGDGYSFYVLDGMTQVYVTLYLNEDGKAALTFSETATAFTYDPYLKAWTAKIDDVTYFLGNTGMYNNVYACLASFLTTETSGKTQFTAVIEAFDLDTAFETETAYKFGLYQANLGKTLYLDGGVSGKYLTTTTSPIKGVDVYAELYRLGGYKFYILVNGEKAYIDITAGACSYAETTDSVFSYNAEIDAWVTDVDGTDYYLGTYNSFNTVSASKTSYINADNTGKTQFPAGFMSVYPMDLIDDINLLVEEGVAYKFMINQANLKKTLYVNGKMNGYYYATSEYFADGVDFFAEEVDGGYAFYFMNGTAKTYINLVKSGTYNNVVFSTSAYATFVYDSTVKAWTTVLSGETLYLGTYNSFNTVSASKISYINAGNTGVSQFPMTLTYADLNTAPEEGVAYKIALNQVKAGKYLYLTGGVDGRYLKTTVKGSEACDIYVEMDGDGYKFYTLDGTTKKYLDIYFNSSDKLSIQFSAEGDVFVYNAATKAWSTIVNDAEYYFGTYNTFETVSASAVSYITAENTGVSQFPAGLTFAGPDPVEPEPEEPETPSEGTSATISFANKAQRTVFNTSQQVWVQNGITVTNNKAASSSNVADYANPARFYASSQLIVECKGMTKIIFTCGSASYANALKNSISGATVTVSGSVVTVVLPAAADSFTVAKLSAQVRVASIEVIAG